MFGNIVVGSIVIAVLYFAFTKTRNDIKNNSCSCGSSCSKKDKCEVIQFK